MEFKSITEMQNYSSWSNKSFFLRSPENESSKIWRTNENRKPIYIEKKENFTIDGGNDGITIYGTSLVLYKCTKVTLRNLTIRLGTKGLTKDIRTYLKDEYDKSGYNGEAIKIYGCKEIVIENCCLSWGLDETLSIESSKNIKIKKCIISYPINNPKNFNGDPIEEEGEPNHAYSCSNKVSEDITYSRCIFANSNKRNPSFSTKGSGNYREIEGTVRNNIIYYFTEEGTKFNTSKKNDDGKSHKLVIHDNYYIGKKKDDDNEFGAILIERPYKGKIKVEYWRNWFGIRVKVGDKMIFKGSKVKPIKQRNNRNGEIKFDEKYADQTMPKVEFNEILDEAGPKNTTSYTHKIKGEINRNVVPQILEGHEPEIF